MKKTISSILILLTATQGMLTVSAEQNFVRKSEYPKYLYDAPVFKKGAEQKKAVEWLINNIGIDNAVYTNYSNGNWLGNDKIVDGSFDRVLRAQKEVQDQVWKKYNPAGSFSMDANGDYLYDKNGLIGPFDKADGHWQELVNRWRADYIKNPPTGFGRKNSAPEAIETFQYSNFNNYRKSDSSRDLNFVKDYLKVRDTMMLYGQATGKRVFAITGITHEYDILVDQMELTRGIFLSLLKQKYYHQGYRDIDEEIKFFFPGVFTDFKDNLTYDGKNVYEKYTPAYITRYFNSDTLAYFQAKQRKEIETTLLQVSDRIDAMRKKSTDENSFLKKVVAYTNQVESLRKTYYENCKRNNWKDMDSFDAMHKMEQVNSMLHGYISFHSVSQIPVVSAPMREYYNMASLDKDGNAVFTKKMETMTKLK